MARTRRTADQARALILETAARRLADHGIKGLNVADVAADAGMTHATVLHHFGSAEAMQRSLAVAMSAGLLQDIIEALRSPGDVDAGALCRTLFDTMAHAGHATLIAWTTVTDQSMAVDDAQPQADLFEDLVTSLSARLDAPPDVARQVIYLIANAAIGSALTRRTLGPLLGMDGEATDAFPLWLAARVDRLIDR